MKLQILNTNDDLFPGPETETLPADVVVIAGDPQSDLRPPVDCQLSEPERRDSHWGKSAGHCGTVLCCSQGLVKKYNTIFSPTVRIT